VACAGTERCGRPKGVPGAGLSHGFDCDAVSEVVDCCFLHEQELKLGRGETRCQLAFIHHLLAFGSEGLINEEAVAHRGSQ